MALTGEDVGRILAVDYGDRRTGLAVSDPRRMIAQPLPTIEESDPDRLARAIARAAAERGVRTIVLGLPLLPDGSEGNRVSKTRAFARRLEVAAGAGVRIVEWDERLTSAEAAEWLREAGLRRNARKKRVDAVAAVLILRSYLGATGGKQDSADRG